MKKIMLSLSLIALLVFSASAQDNAEENKGWVPGKSKYSAVFKPAIAAAQKRTVKIAGRGLGKEKGYATGVVVSPKGLVLTAQGIFLADDLIRVIMPNGKSYFAEVVRRNEPLQVALLQIKTLEGLPLETPEYFEMPKKNIVDPGDWVLAVGNWFKVAEGQEEMSVTLGVVSMRGELEVRHRRLDVPFDGEKIIVDSITSNPGSAGSALVSLRGRFVGLVGKLFMSKSTNTRLNYAIPAHRLIDFIEGKEEKIAEADKEKPKGKPYLGIRIFSLAGSRSPAYIGRVYKDSPAAKAGLKKNDLILVMGEKEVVNVRAYKKMVKDIEIGKELLLIVKRGESDILAVKLTPEAEED